MIPRVYIDTSIVGGFFDKEFSKDTQALFKRLENNEVIFIISSVLQQELQMAPVNVRQLLNTYKSNYFEFIKLSETAIELAKKYINEKVMGSSGLNDCLHIAMATIHKADVLVSWNFKHIVNLDRIKGYNGVNLKHGFSTVEIRSPKELINYEKK